jgi:hypothetical protein
MFYIAEVLVEGSSRKVLKITLSSWFEELKRLVPAE